MLVRPRIGGERVGWQPWVVAVGRLPATRLGRQAQTLSVRPPPKAGKPDDEQPGSNRL